SLGAACADCHTEASWKQARFDHDKTRFALTGRHAQADCADCHKTKGDYKSAPRTCIGCHRKDDEGAKGHKGRYGDKCESCHGTKGWKPSSFVHDADTRFALRGAHRSTACSDCHTGPLYQQKLPTGCNGCHARDDKHKGTLGTDCAACHTEKSWKERSRFDHDKTRFPLLGKHVQARCEACHKSADFKAAPRECVECHRAEDKHAGTLGTACADCHNERDWKTTTGRFDHDKTRFRLRNKHAAPLACTACHADSKHMRDTPTACASCHTKHDKHEGQLGKECERCHDDRSWKVPHFDHARTRFALLGRHLAVACKDCHATPRYRDARSECIACHERDDKHKRAFGTRCDGCHNARAWPLANFDHDKTAYRLDTTHRKLACEGCHRQPAPPGKPAAAIGSTCIACHRKDDVHDGGLGARCEQCHVSASWKKVQPLGVRP
ncbi:MAG: cytochrome c3 family protein, partial [Pseudomonadota bacterium]